MTEARTTVQRGYIHWCGVTCVNRKDSICIGEIPLHTIDYVVWTKQPAVCYVGFLV